MTVDDTPYTITAGSAGSPVILHVPHGSRAIPPAVRTGILLDDDALATELDHMTDAHTTVIAERAAAQAAIPPWRFANELSRLVIDPERFPDEREEMRGVGMGAVYTRTSDGLRLREDDPAAEQALLDAYFRPYAAAMTGCVQDRLDAVGRAVVIDVHSYPAAPLPYELHADGPRPAVCLGTDPFHTPGWLLDAAREAFAGCDTVGLDSPFAGAYVPLRHYGAVREVSALMIEIRRDVDGPAGIDRLVRALADLVDQSGIRKRAA
ncbi:N-formylglutamate amidohydrolase [Actinacidiphila soli]|jgi:N-formylglutamate amidohydrolase|uniref:N-formylglutamate amidohydrolase n=1 Tax=Actinacidiphila soli TaxID=2487275 RepID=UPI000FCC64BD|nr:N-formylglutamate amidohydrolase [Actinacidiphila soli]